MAFLGRFAVVVVVLVAVLLPSQASAQLLRPPMTPDSESPFGTAPIGRDNGRLDVEVSLGAADGTGSVYISAPGASQLSEFELGRAVGDALGVERSGSDVTTETDQPLGDMDDIQVTMSGRLDMVVENKPTLVLDPQSLERVVRNWDFTGVDLTVCNDDRTVSNGGLPLVDLTPGSTARKAGGCYEWQLSLSQLRSAPDIRVQQQPEPERFTMFAGIFGGIMVAIGVAVASLVIAVRRKWFTHLNASTLVMILVFTALAVLSTLVVSFVMAFVGRPFTDLAAAYNLSEGAYAMSVIAVGLLGCLPFLIPTLVLARAKPPSYQPVPQPTYAPQPSMQPAQRTTPGVPSWIVAGQGAAPPPAKPASPQQSVPEQNPSPPQPQPQPEEQRPSSPPDDTSGWSPPS